MFDAYSRIGGAGISSNVKLVIHEETESITIDGKPKENLQRGHTGLSC